MRWTERERREGGERERVEGEMDMQRTTSDLQYLIVRERGRVA